MSNTIFECTSFEKLPENRFFKVKFTISMPKSAIIKALIYLNHINPKFLVTKDLEDNEYEILTLNQEIIDVNDDLIEALKSSVKWQMINPANV